VFAREWPKKHTKMFLVFKNMNPFTKSIRTREQETKQEQQKLETQLQATNRIGFQTIFLLAPKRLRVLPHCPTIKFFHWQSKDY